MDMQAIISQLAVLFILLLLGYISGKTKFLSPETGKVLTKVVMNITMPCTALSSAIYGNLEITGGETAFFMLASLLSFLIFFVISIPSARILSRENQTRGLLSYMIVFPNSGFIGFPVTLAIFGSGSVYYAALFLIVLSIFLFTAGTIMMSGRIKKLNPKAILTPGLIASLLVIPLALIRFQAPFVIAEVIQLTGNITSPAAMLIVGVTLSQIPVKAVFSKWRLYPMAILKLIVLPLAVWLVFKQIVDNELMLGMLVILSAMPTAAIAVMHAIELGNDERLASSGIFLTTLLSCATIPLVVYTLLM